MKKMIFKSQRFSQLSLWKKLGLIVVIKLIIMFLVLKIFFFPDFLKTNFNSDKDRSDYVIDQLTK